jgi:uncharacterized protein
LAIVEHIAHGEPGEAGVRGYLHRAAHGRDGIVLTHGAGGNCQSQLLIELAEYFARMGITVLRCDLPFRQLRPKGPPLGTAQQDQAGLLRAMEVLRQHVHGRLFLGGHSYGGRMASMLAAENPSVADGLLLLSYPLHPPRKPEQLRTAHFPMLHTRSMFVQGTRDPFATIEEIRAALEMIPAESKLTTIDGAGHELFSKKTQEAVEGVANEFQQWRLSES